MIENFHNIKRLPPYVFAEVNKLKAAARAEGRDIIDFGFGNPDQPAPAHVVEKLTEVAQKPRSMDILPVGVLRDCEKRFATITLKDLR